MTQEDKDQECKKCGRVFGSVRCFDVDCPNNTPNNTLKITMSQEEKDLLLNDLCGRLPYGVILSCCDIVGEKLTAIDTNPSILINNDYDIDEVKPYLFPLNSMTEEQLAELRLEHERDLKNMAICMKKCSEGDNSLRGKNISYHAVNWCNKNHFDYRGLIPMGLANDATDKNIY